MNSIDNLNEKHIKMQRELVNFYTHVLSLLTNNKKIHEENQDNDKKIITTFETKIDKKNSQIKAIYKKEIVNKKIKIPNKKLYLIIMTIEITNDINKIKRASLKEEADNDNYIIVSNLSINKTNIYNNMKEMKNYESLEEIINNKNIYQIIKNANKELCSYQYNSKQLRKRILNNFNIEDIFVYFAIKSISFLLLFCF